jgi:hypothetical protein
LPVIPAGDGEGSKADSGRTRDRDSRRTLACIPLGAGKESPSRGLPGSISQSSNLRGILDGMTDQTSLKDPMAILRRVVAAYDALQAAFSEHGNEPAFIDAAKAALGAAMDDARRVTNAPQPWRREKRRR